MSEQKLAGARVLVMDGTGEGPERKGTLVDHVTVYAIFQKPEGEDGELKLLSLKEAETPIEVLEGQTVQTLENNPKIVLDDGETVYGCQVWWQFEDTPENKVIIIENSIKEAEELIANMRKDLAEARAALGQPAAEEEKASEVSA
jgi:hypothetical protein